MVRGVAEGRSGDRPRPRSGRRPTRSQGAATINLALRFALNAPPFGLRRASLRARETAKARTKSKNARLLI
jgi:hypothetical protein